MTYFRFTKQLTYLGQDYRMGWCFRLALVLNTGLAEALEAVYFDVDGMA